MKRKIFLFIILMIVILFTSCENPLHNTFEILKDEADYFPLSVGNYWRYSSRLGDSYSLRVQEIVFIGEKSAFRVEKNQEGSYSSQYFYSSKDGVEIYSGTQGWYFYMKYPFIKGISWTFSQAGLVYEFIFEEWTEAETPAGKFNNTAKFYVTAGTPIGEEINIENEYYYWYAKNVGLVKIEQFTSDTGDLELIQLVDYKIN